MKKKDTYQTMTVQMLGVICFAAVIALVTGLIWHGIGIAIVDHFYYSESSINRRLAEEINSFRNYVAEHQMASIDIRAVEIWNRDHPHTQLTIRGQNTTIRSSAYGVELAGTESDLMVQYGQAAKTSMPYTVKFSDGSYIVVVRESNKSTPYEVVRLTAIVLGASVFLAILLIYDQKVARSIQTLSRQVRQVSQGDLDRTILSERQDEIGQLATDVNQMRLSIIEKLQREEEAWQANSKLITAISHDVRTPLTALMGYLELLDDPEIPLSERITYLDICKNHAWRLKGLTDELFGFFLVFGQPAPDLRMEEFQAAVLLDQILLEKELELSQQGFTLQAEHPPIAGSLRVDAGHLRRVFDNLFSNVRKYADPAQPVTVTQEAAEGHLLIGITNAIRTDQIRVESNRIGLQTCQKLIVTMGGQFRKDQTDQAFSVEIRLPLYE